MQRKSSNKFKTTKIVLIILTSIILLVLAIILTNKPSWKYASEETEKATSYLENYYAQNNEYPSEKEFYNKFDEKIAYITTSKHHYTLEYETKRVHEGAYGTPYTYMGVLESHINYYTSSCDTSRRCNWQDFNNKNLVTGQNEPIHNKDSPYFLIKNIVNPINYDDPNLQKIYTYAWQISFIEKESGETFKYENLTYDPLFYNKNLTETQEIGSNGDLWNTKTLTPTGNLGETKISYDLTHCNNISTNDCDSPKHIEMNLVIYNKR